MDPCSAFYPSGLVCNDCGLSVGSSIESVVTTSDCYQFQLTAFLIDSVIVFGAKALNSLGQY